MSSRSDPGFERRSAVTTILGLNAYHADSAACLVRDGELIAAGREEVRDL